MKKNRSLSLLYAAISLLGGAALYGISMNMFLSPGKVVMGGATGIATTVNFLFDRIPIGLTIVAINVPLLLLNMRSRGLSSMARTIVGITVSSVAIDMMTFLPVTVEDPLLCSVLGGITMGCGSGLMMNVGYTTGGSDLAAVMVAEKARRISTGKMILVIDAVIVIGSAVILRNYEGVIYSAIAVFTYSIAVDSVMGGADRAKMVIVISDSYERISKAITDGMDRGVTLLDGAGGYTGDKKKVLMCVVKRREEYALKKLVETVDPAAFMILSDATEVLGDGFKKLENEGSASKRLDAEKKDKKEKREKRKAAKREKRAERKAVGRAAKLRKKEEKANKKRRKGGLK